MENEKQLYALPNGWSFSDGWITNENHRVGVVRSEDSEVWLSAYVRTGEPYTSRRLDALTDRSRGAYCAHVNPHVLLDMLAGE